MVIKTPLLSNILCEFHDKVTREAKESSPEQRVKDIADKVVGRVPANLCKLFLLVLSKREVSKITWIASESPVLSKIPPPEQSFFRNKGGHDRRGGGKVIPCEFQLGCYDSTYDHVYQYFTKTLQELSFQGEEVIEKNSETQSCLF